MMDWTGGSGRDERDSGQASLLGLGVCFLAIAIGAVLVVVGRVHVAHAELQQAADVAAETLANGTGDDPQRHARALARANGASELKLSERDGIRGVEVRARAPRVLGVAAGTQLQAWAALPEPPVFAGQPGTASGTPYTGPLVVIDSAVVCPAVAAEYRAMQRSAAVAGVRLWAVSGWRSFAEQAVLFATLGPTLAARPGTSLHHSATELDITVGPAGSTTHRWLGVNGGRFHFIQRYSWEPWHWGSVRGC